MVNPVCPCGADVGTTEDFLLHSNSSSLNKDVVKPVIKFIKPMKCYNSCKIYYRSRHEVVFWKMCVLGIPKCSK